MKGAEKLLLLCYASRLKRDNYEIRDIPIYKWGNEDWVF